MNYRDDIKKAKRIVLKFGTNVLTRHDGTMALSRIYSFIEAVSDLKKQGKEIVIVTSGAVGMGAKKLGMESKPVLVSLKKACAAIGQGQLMYFYEEAFEKFSVLTAQMLLTEDDFSKRKKYLSLKDTLNNLLELGVIPIINENDAISTYEFGNYHVEDIIVSFGDNDKLSALVMSTLDADLLVILSDIDGLYDDNPNENPNAQLIPLVKKITPEIEALGFGAGSKGRGGMKTKLEAAKVATRSGGMAIIANGKKSGTIESIFKGEEIGTVFLPYENLSSRKQWIGYASTIIGRIKVNDGAKQAIIENNASLLSAGILEIIRDFNKCDIVSILDSEENEFARGMINYSSSECKKLIGKQSDEIEEILGHKNYDEIILKDNIVIL